MSIRRGFFINVCGLGITSGDVIDALAESFAMRGVPK